MTENEKKFIDEASYETLLRLWRFKLIGSKYFSGELGEYYKKVMFEKKKHCDHVRASKNVRWEF